MGVVLLASRGAAATQAKKVKATRAENFEVRVTIAMMGK
jgi:hypothetical protein